MPKITKTDVDRDQLKLRLRQLESLHTHGLGQIGVSREMFDTRALMAELKLRLNPPPAADLEAKAAELIARFGQFEWVTSALAEAE
jgi:hypothetical protein